MCEREKEAIELCDELILKNQFFFLLMSCLNYPSLRSCPANVSVGDLIPVPPGLSFLMCFEGEITALFLHRHIINIR